MRSNRDAHPDAQALPLQTGAGGRQQVGQKRPLMAAAEDEHTHTRAATECTSLTQASSANTTSSSSTSSPPLIPPSFYFPSDFPSSPVVANHNWFDPEWRSFIPEEVCSHALPSLRPPQDVPASFPAALRPLLGVWHCPRPVWGEFVQMQLQPDFTWELVTMKCIGLHGDKQMSVGSYINPAAAAAAAASSSAPSQSVGAGSSSESVIPFPCLVTQKRVVVPARGQSARWTVPGHSPLSQEELMQSGRNAPLLGLTTKEAAEWFEDTDIRSASYRGSGKKHQRH